jgi:hypothetical protein
MRCSTTLSFETEGERLLPRMDAKKRKTRKESTPIKVWVGFGGLIKMWLTTNADFESVSAQGLQRKLENTLSDVRLLQKKMSDRLEDL